MVMIVKRGDLPPPTWENNLMSRFPPGADWTVSQELQGFSARVGLIHAPYLFQEWTDALLWVGKQLCGPEALREFPRPTQ